MEQKWKAMEFRMLTERHKSLKILTWRQCINASAGMLCKQKLYFPLFSPKTLAISDASLFRCTCRCPDARHDFFKMANVTSVRTNRLIKTLFMVNCCLWSADMKFDLVHNVSPTISRKRSTKNVAFLNYLSICDNVLADV